MSGSTTKIMLATLLIAISTVASAQLLGGRVGAGAGVNVPPVGGTVDSAARTTDALGSDARATARSNPRVTVRAGASTRVARGSRCYYQPDDSYYDPAYRDGYYYCEQRGGSVAAKASVKTGH